MTEGNEGSVPQWYRLLVAARYLKVAPWDLAVRPAWWTNIAIAAQATEASVERAHAKRRSNRADSG